ncbi:Zinc finger FYVE domain-containing protein 19 [Escovopsis weberi]|uniref:Zinc finger FYVE domain-containing protein 19 n=1 Tax=Escovopsis weberi TaxID=150374 RepID=A0A0M8N252_ESCWE|nr:Zinc finger FYVE domain-containing protein 19 [Escovopsis weberi]
MPGGQSRESAGDGEDVDAMLQTDFRLLEEMLAHIIVDDGEPTAEQVRALIDEVSRGGIPQDQGEEDGSDCSNTELADRRADDFIARFRDEIELEAALHPNDQDENDSPDAQQDVDPSSCADVPASDESAHPPPEIPSLPQTLDPLPSAPSSSSSSPLPAGTGMDDIAARLALLRAPGTSAPLPSVPSSAPSSSSCPKPRAAKRLTSTTTAYTDADADGWCVVCLEDATLRCPACDGDMYCARCWREMHVGPAAAFDDRSHRAVYLARDRERRPVALGA